MDLLEKKERMAHLVLLVTLEDQERKEIKVHKVEMGLLVLKVKEAKMVFRVKEVKLVPEASEVDLAGLEVKELQDQKETLVSLDHLGKTLLNIKRIFLL